MSTLVLGGLRQVLWNRSEHRPRAPVRFLATLTLLAGALFVVGAIAGLVDALVGSTGPTVAAVGEVVLLAGIGGATLAIIRFVDGRYLHDIGLGLNSHWRREFLFGLALGAGMVVGIVGPALALGFATVDGTLVNSEAALLGELSVVSGLVVGAGFFLVLGALEEILFRGYLLVNVAEGLAGLLDDTGAIRVGVVVSSVAFGVVHALNPDASVLSTVNIMLVGGVLAVGYVLTDSLAIPIGVHVAWNYALGVVFGLPVSGLTTGVALVDLELDGSTLVTGGAFGPEGGLLTLVALGIAVAGIAWLLRRREGGLALERTVAQPDLHTRD